MFQSHVVEVNGTFIGAAMTVPSGFRFHAVHPRVEALEGRVWSTLAELRRAATHLFIVGRLRSASESDRSGAAEVGDRPAALPAVSRSRSLPAAPWVPR